MLRTVSALLLTLIISAPLLAQQPPPQRMRIPAEKIQPLTPTTQKAEQPKQVPVDQKLRYIVKQLNLDDKQKQHAEGLFAILQSESNMTPEETKDRMEAIMSAYRAMQDAEKAGDKARTEELRAELRAMAPGAAAERNFVKGLMPVLNEQQQEKFQSLLAKLEKATDISLKPIEVVRLARSLNLTPEQSQRLDKIQEEFRKSVATDVSKGPEPAAALDTGTAKSPESQRLDKLVTDISAILNPTQRAKFESEVAARRPEDASEATPKPASKP